MCDCRITLNYFKEKARMTKMTDNGFCTVECSKCPLHLVNNGMNMFCGNLESRYPERAISIVQRWSDTHPKGTYLSKFIKNYPDAELGEDGTPKKICPHDLGLTDIESCAPGEPHCTECWNQIIPESDN